MRPVFRVKTPGAHTTIQDRGRFAYQHMGVPVSGALDPFAFRVANMLVGNPRDAAALEITFAGPQLEVLSQADIGITGADMRAWANGNPIHCWQSVRIQPGSILIFGQAREGCRTYLAVNGGFHVPTIMGSRSTYSAGRLGGLEGRPLKAGDILMMGAGELLRKPRRLPWRPCYPDAITLRAVPGPQDDYFVTDMGIFFSSDYTVSSLANRMGYRLEGPSIQRDPGCPESIVSEPSITGNIQIPPDGKPIILLVEQTIGGYAKIATVITPDLFKIAQAKPGDNIRFWRVSLEEAHHAYRRWSAFVEDIEGAIQDF